MSEFPHKIISCRALAPVITELVGSSVPITILDIALHLQPELLRKTLIGTIASIEQDNTIILLGYGLCGRAVEGVYATKATLVLPRVDDCVGVLLGSRSRHKLILGDHPGSYFMDPQWLDTELNIFVQMAKGLDHISPERRRQLLKIALKHYDRLVFLADSHTGAEARERCQALAAEYELELHQLTKELSLIDRLLHGPWDENDFVVVPPNTPIPLF